MEMCRLLFQGFNEIQSDRHRSTLLFQGAQKLKKYFNHIFLFYFYTTFLAAWGYASDFL